MIFQEFAYILLAFLTEKNIKHASCFPSGFIDMRDFQQVFLMPLFN